MFILQTSISTLGDNIEFFDLFKIWLFPWFGRLVSSSLIGVIAAIMICPSLSRSSLYVRTFLRRDLSISSICPGLKFFQYHASALSIAYLQSSHISTFSTSNLLSETSKQNCISKLQNQSSPRPTLSAHDSKKSAVLLPLVNLDGQAGLVFTKRSGRLRSHRGEVSFPGGKHDEGDTSLVETACRETCEELGVSRGQIEIWSEMPPYSTYDKGGHVLTPVVGFLHNFSSSDLKVNSSEVDEVFCIPISQLCEERLQGYTQFRNQYSLPVYNGPPHVVWGITALMTYQLLNALLLRNVYNHHLVFQSPINPSSKSLWIKTWDGGDSSKDNR